MKFSFLRPHWALAIAAFALIAVTACNKYEDDWTDDEVYGEDSGSSDWGSDAEGDEGSLTLYSVSGNSITKVKDYSVPNSLLSYQQDVAKHNEMWDFVTTLFPQDERAYVNQYEVLHGGGSLLGWVEPVSEDDLGKWTFALDISHAYVGGNLNGDGDFAHTVLHEWAHVATLNETQFDETGWDEEACSNYFNGYCGFANGYLEAYVDRFWADILDEWADAYYSDDYDELDAIAERYSDRWVTDYAATSPEEDIAEAFTLFVLEDRAGGNSMTAQKVNFFYAYPELVNLREHIRSVYAHPVSAKTSSKGVFAGKRRTCVHRK